MVFIGFAARNFSHDFFRCHSAIVELAKGRNGVHVGKQFYVQRLEILWINRPFNVCTSNI